MKFTQARIFFASLALLGILVVVTGCNGGAQDGDKTKDSVDTPQVVRVEPQNFPVNELPDSLFGKAITTTEEKGLKTTTTQLTAVAGTMPEWLDQIISRESIVRFGNPILQEMPDEVEFVQTGSTLYDAGDNLFAFVVTFSTRPSNVSMVVYGGYMDEERSYWASQSSKDKLEMSLKGAKATTDGVELHGEWTGAKTVPFKANLTKAKTTLVNGK
jgi:hypothetical protein